MNPGRKLDALVAEKVMNLENVRYQMLGYHHDLVFGENVLAQVAQLVPNYSTDISAAWKVVDELGDRKWLLVMYKANTIVIPQYWFASFDFKYPDDSKPETDYEFAETAPHAICLASLKIGRSKL